MIEPLCYDQDCLIVGSAPSLVISPDEEYGCVLAANGGAALARDAGLEVDCLITTSYLFRGEGLSDAEEATLDIMRNLMVQHVWVDTKSGPLNWAIQAMVYLPISWQEAYAVEPKERSMVVNEAVGRDLWVSSGLWAVCLAVVSDARSVTLAGISLNNGHYGMEDTAPRDHIIQDRLCIDLLTSQLSGGIW